MKILIGILIPFLGTTIGSSIVFFLNKKAKKLEKILLSLSAGIMLAASFWSLLSPAIEQSKNYKINWFPETIGILLGLIFFITIEKITNKTSTEKLSLAVTLHNIPEGMAVGVIFAGLLNNSGITYSMALSLAIGIGIQNIPEGAIISLPYKMQGKSKIKAFILGTLSGVVEPIASSITLIITNYIKILLPYILSFAASAMIYVVVDELIPQTKDNKKYPIIFFMIGFTIMMILDITL